MSVFRRVITYMRPYRKRLVLSVLCSIIYSVFSGVSIYLIIPLLETLFGGSSPGTTVVVPGSPSLVPGWLVELKAGVSHTIRARFSMATPMIHCSVSAPSLSWHFLSRTSLGISNRTS